MVDLFRGLAHEVNLLLTARSAALGADSSPAEAAPSLEPAPQAPPPASATSPAAAAAATGGAGAKTVPRPRSTVLRGGTAKQNKEALRFLQDCKAYWPELLGELLAQSLPDHRRSPDAVKYGRRDAFLSSSSFFSCCLFSSSLLFPLYVLAFSSFCAFSLSLSVSAGQGGQGCAYLHASGVQHIVTARAISSASTLL